MTFGIPKLNSCCCLSLSTCTILISIFHLVWMVFALTVHMILFPTEGMQHMIGSINAGCLAGFLLYGDLMLHPHSMFPWLLYNITSLTAICLAVVSKLIMLGLIEIKSPFLVFLCVGAGWQAFVLLIVFSRYREIKGMQG